MLITCQYRILQAPFGELSSFQNSPSECAMPDPSDVGPSAVETAQPDPSNELLVQDDDSLLGTSPLVYLLELTT
jgi:hypothetical protein